MSAQFSPPPRRVPLSLAIVNLCGGSGQIGWFIFGFGMIFVWLFAGHADYSVIDFRGARQEAVGTIERVWRTGASENRQTIMANAYSFTVGGRTLHGVSYSLGGSATPGSTTRIEYLTSKPEMSRIAGMRRGEFGPFVIFVAIFPLVGVFIIAYRWQTGARHNDLLRAGILTGGKLKEQVATNTTVNNRRVYKMTFEFAARNGRRYETSVLSSRPERLTDEEQEPLLYDPENPPRAYVLDEAPSRPQLDGIGELIGRPAAAFFSLLVPLIVLMGNALAALVHFR